MAVAGAERAAPSVGLITIWYETAAEIDRFAARLNALEYAAVRPVFVVHALSHDAVEHLRSAVPRAAILEPGANLGPAAGWNLAIGHLLAEGVDYIGIMNVDTHFHPRCLNRLVAFMQTTPDVGACQPLLGDADEPDRVQMYGGSFSVHSGLATHDFKRAYFSKSLPATRDADYLDGGCVLVRAEILRAIGGFDERLFMYAEDVDLSLRIQRFGYRTVAVRDARAWHAHPDDAGHLPARHQVFYRTRNRFRLVWKFGGPLAWVALVGRTVVWELPRGAVFYVRRGRADLLRALALGIAHGVTSRFGKRGWVG